MDGNKRVILIKGSGNKWYEQAIFIVRHDVPEKYMPVDFVAEAEKIINGYMKDSNRHKPGRSRKAPKARNTAMDYVLNTIVIVCCVALAGILTYAFFG